MSMNYVGKIQVTRKALLCSFSLAHLVNARKAVQRQKIIVLLSRWNTIITSPRLPPTTNMAADNTIPIIVGWL
jgi:hypothetical protein